MIGRAGNVRYGSIYGAGMSRYASKYLYDGRYPHDEPRRVLRTSVKRKDLWMYYEPDEWKAMGGLTPKQAAEAKTSSRTVSAPRTGAGTSTVGTATATAQLMAPDVIAQQIVSQRTTAADATIWPPPGTVVSDVYIGPAGPEAMPEYDDQPEIGGVSPLTVAAGGIGLIVLLGGAYALFGGKRRRR
jgi:hypothetical protein